MAKRFKLAVCLLALVLLFAPTKSTFAASAQDFYFKDFTADYYLTRQDDGTSNLHVKETMTAVFPETDQNHGITRIIPITNQNGANRTINSQSDMHLTVLRNGNPEPIGKIESDVDSYIVYVGSADVYVHGEQTYTLEYDYTDVITEFDPSGRNVSGQDAAIKAFQELYWDTNGNGWRQTFEKLTANLHLDSSIKDAVIKDKTSCYVGRYGVSGSDRCTITTIADGFSFTTANLTSGENLTFAVDFQPGAFTVLIETSYILVIIFLIVLAFCIWAVVAKFLAWRKLAYPNRHLYKTLFETPQYLPPEDKDIHVAEGGYIYLKKTKPSYVATLLELAVTKAITITKVSDATLLKKATWSIHVNADPATLSQPQLYMLRVLANKSDINQGDDIEIKKHTATTTLASYARSYDSHSKITLETKGYLGKNGSNKFKGNEPAIAISALFWISCMVILFANEWAGSLIDKLNATLNYSYVVGEEIIPILIFFTIIATAIAYSIMSSQITKFSKYTESGIRLANYLEGLELYIKMAEADRLAFLQSVEGADTSEKGIVKLYEKLLPWACLFGQEKSWMEELSKYYEVADIPEAINSDVINGIIAANIIHDINSTVHSSTSYYQSSGGGSSSGSSGGGGGGFSGGGGGGGGGGGW